jgi:hypothetical protein
MGLKKILTTRSRRRDYFYFVSLDVIQLFLLGVRYGHLAVQVGGVSDERVIYGYGSYATLTSE